MQPEVLCALKLDEDIRGKLGKLPPKLEQLYLEVYNELSLYPGDIGRSIVTNTLKWLLCAQRMLHTSEFLWAVAVDLDIAFEDITRDLILDLCHNFILYDEGLDMFRFAHLSVREFLEKRPEFSQIPCNLLAAESCLLQIIGSSHCSNPDPNSSDVRVTRLRGRMASRAESASKDFLAYANAEWMNHCKLIPQRVRLDHLSLERLLRPFLDEDSGLVSAFNAWVRWYCSRMLGKEATVASWQLQTLLSDYSRPPFRSFFVAIAFGFSEVVTLCVRNRAIGNQAKCKGLVLASMATHHGIFDLLVSGERDWELTEPILFYAMQDSDNERLTWLLDKCTNINLTTCIMATVGKGQNDGSMALLLQKYPGLIITEQMLMASVVSANQDSFRLLLARATDAVSTNSLLRTAISETQSDKLSSLLDRMKRGGAAHIPIGMMISAARRPYTKALQIMLDHGGTITQEVLVAVAGVVNADVLRVLLKHGCVVDGKILRLQAKHGLGDATLTIMLDHVSEAVVAGEMINVIFEVASSRPNGSTMRLLLDRAQSIKVPGDVLLAAACNDSGGSHMMYVFLAKGRTEDITTELLICAMGNLDIIVIVQLLDRVEYKGIIHELIAAAANNVYCGGELVRLLLKGADIPKITDVVFDNAIGNIGNGKEVIQALEETFGPIEVTEDVMLKLIRQASGKTCLPSGADYLFDPGQITEKIFYSAMSIDPPWSTYETSCQMPNIRHIVAENALHLPVTPDILKAAGRYCDVHCFRYLWNRGGMAKVANDVMQEAAKNKNCGCEILLFLLEQVENVEIGEGVILAIVGNRFCSKELFNLLWERGFKLPVTHPVLKTAIATIQFEKGGLWLLNVYLNASLMKKSLKIYSRLPPRPEMKTFFGGYQSCVI